MKITTYKDVFSKVGREISIFDWLKGNENLNHKIHDLRGAPKQKQTEMKKYLPVIIPAGTFSSPDDNGLINFSGIMCFDFDYVPDAEEMKYLIMKNPYTWYCGLSASGTGLFALVKVSDQAPTKWKEYFAAISNTFGRAGRFLDTKACNIARKRFYSFDPDPGYNLKALDNPFVLTEKTTNVNICKRDVYKVSQQTNNTQVTRNHPNFNEEKRLKKLIRIIENQQIDVTASYNDWISIAGALANIFGESGRDYFHKISQFYSTYCQNKTDQQYDNCLKNTPNFGFGVILTVAKKYQIFLKHEY